MDSVLNNTILRGEVGSNAYGTAVGASSDRDEMGVFIESRYEVCGLKGCDHYTHRTKPEGVKSGPGDLDLTLYSLRKFCALAAAGNPSILMLLYLPEYTVKTELGARLILMRRAFISKTAGFKYLGYLKAQKEKMLGQRAHTVNRPDLVEAHGYDTKFAMHALRLGLQGIELLETQHMTLPIAEPDLSKLRAIRSGQVTEEEALMMIESAEVKLRAVVDDCNLIQSYGHIDDFMVEAHMRHWNV